MKYIILKLCCGDCRKFYDLYITDDFFGLLFNIEDYEDYCYYIYDYQTGVCICSIDGSCIGGVNNG